MRIHGNLFVTVGIFVAQSGERVPEFVYNDGLEERVLGHGKIIRVEDSAAAIFIGVHEHYDVFVGGSG